MPDQGAARELANRTGSVTAHTRRLTRTGVAVLALTGLAAALRFVTLDAKGYWGDEISTVFLVRMPFGRMLGSIARLESTPPLYYSLAWLWTKPLGTSEVGLRSLSALFGVATVPVIYIAARELVSRFAALAAAAMVAINPLLVWYSQEARSYSLLALLSAAGLLCFARALRAPRGPALTGWGLMSALALATHYFAGFLVLPEAVALLSVRGGRRVAVPAVAGVGVACTALLPLAVHQASFGHAAWISHSSLSRRILTLPGEFFAGFDAPILLGTGLGIVAAIGAGLCLKGPPGHDRRGAALMARVAVAAIAVPVALALIGVDYFNSRNSLPVLLPLTIAVSVGYAGRTALGRLSGVAFATLSLAVVLATAGQPKFHSEDWRGAAEDLGRSVRPRAVVVTPGQAGRKPLEYYLGAARLRVPVRVTEVDVLALPRQGSPRVADGYVSRLLRLRLPRFRLSGVHRERDFALLRYIARAPVPVSSPQLDHRVGRNAASVIPRPRVLAERAPASQLAQAGRSRSEPLRSAPVRAPAPRSSRR